MKSQSLLSKGDNLHEISMSTFWEKWKNMKNISKCRLLKLLPSMLSVHASNEQCGSDHAVWCRLRHMMSILCSHA